MAVTASGLFLLSYIDMFDTTQLTLDHDGTVSDAIAFGFGDEDPGPGAVLDLVATAELDTFRGTRRTRLRVTKLARRPNAD